jgi:hypothetical protein
VRTVLSFLTVILVSGAASAGQLARSSPVAADTAASFDQTRTFNGGDATGVIADAEMSVGLGGGFEGMLRPWAMRQASGEWNKQIWIAASGTKRPGPIGLRVDAGLIPSPVGLSNLMLRPQLNPTVSLPASLFQPLPATEVGGPRATLLGAVYAFGANGTVSGDHWDARVAVIDYVAAAHPAHLRRHESTAFQQRGGRRWRDPVRRPARRRLGDAWRLAASQRESRPVTENRDATIVTIESEFSFRYTKLLGEWVRDTMETSGADHSRHRLVRAGTADADTALVRRRTRSSGFRHPH